MPDQDDLSSSFVREWAWVVSFDVDLTEPALVPDLETLQLKAFLKSSREEAPHEG